MGDKFGRRSMLFAGGTIMILGAAILGSSINIPQLIASRIITGIGNALEDKDADDVEIERMILDIRFGLEEEAKGGPFRFKELFSWGEVQDLRRLIITISVQLF
ncbi:hypothetical protein CLAFUW4_12568 [Fulvia fulva]|uniref:Major facilitator superfamily (MFS) profile domain-containing protein n=1 Tax=Passalora fulva TaxID=5499 RepID=A0A9Q8PDQ1_PASFU|nr:uncharacterized protein CLAFUR5_11593 [Fulvia fulva]KAK4617914.1 hypothetical protein CLAFUR4_12573 [Fulvia fulva]KAK4618455.1 hypothetical protein CLAFUR0_12584 [Fulvia fulva]UJO20684.1 hypothetical protein CLAFUR5_11593 [Fulvia fulva]WPV18101.1 hypothetical protein CLAFUW4_12568 [Fulvia fulva]WPV32779.1 hypothetical protein CLAFUW7_12575 [Fulvia fulva]